MPESQRLSALRAAVEQLRALSDECGVAFPQEIFATGGQAKNPGYMKRKAAALGVALVEANCDDAELLGDACAAWYGLGVYESLADAAQSIVKEGKHYETI